MVDTPELNKGNSCELQRIAWLLWNKPMTQAVDYAFEELVEHLKFEGIYNCFPQQEAKNKNGIPI